MPHIKQVYDSLHEVEAALGELREVALRERDDIVALNMDALEERRHEMETIYERVGQLNNKVSQQIITACTVLRVAGESTLSQLITAVPKPDRDMYVSLQNSVRNISSAVENELAVNRALLKDSIAFTTYSMQMFTGIMKSSSNNTYGQQGRFVETIDQPQIICKEI